MAAYVIADVRIEDKTGYEEYRQRVGSTISRFGGIVQAIVGAGRGGKCEVIEGDWRPKHIVLLEFENIEKAKKWYYSPEYTEVAKKRKKTAETNFIIIENT